MAGGHGAGMPTVHGFNHAVGFFSTDFPDDNAVGTQAQGSSYQIDQGDFTVAIRPWRPCFETQQVGRILQV